MTRRGVCPSWRYEEAALQRGFCRIGGVDEAGRGPIAGPVVAACVVLADGDAVTQRAGADDPFGAVGIRDSKQMSESARTRAYDIIMASAHGVGTGVAGPAEIDQTNILRATRLAMCRAIEACDPAPDYALVDGLPVALLPVPNEAIVRGDALCMSIAAASIVAKVTRDRIMEELHAQFPAYGFARNKGYPTPDHLEALRVHGPCAAHRSSFAPVRLHERSLFAGTSPAPSARAAGATGEAWARHYLECLGHRILAVGYRSGRAEVDIVSEERGTIVFTEVKTCSTRPGEAPAARLTQAQRQRICAAADAYLAVSGLSDRECRFDVIEVVRGRSRSPGIRHYRGAFVQEEHYPSPSGRRQTSADAE